MSKLWKQTLTIFVMLTMFLTKGTALADLFGLFNSEPEHPIIRADLAGSEASYNIKVRNKYGWTAF